MMSIALLLSPCYVAALSLEDRVTNLELNMFTKADAAIMKAEMKADAALMREEMKADMLRVNTEADNDWAEMKRDIVSICGASDPNGMHGEQSRASEAGRTRVQTARV